MEYFDLSTINEYYPNYPDDKIFVIFASDIDATLCVMFI